MAKSKKIKQEEREDLLKEVKAHYDEAFAELQTRATHPSQGFDEYDNLYRSYIKPDKWPFNTKIFVPLTFKSIYSKDTRLITGKIKGKLVAGEYGNELGARIGTELLSAQYDDHDNFFEEPLVSKFFRLSQNARKYGAGFALVAWRKETRNGEVVFDGPTVEVLDNRKVYLQPRVTSISNSDYVIVEREMTLDQLKTINDVSLKKWGVPAYQNLDKLEKLTSSQVKEEISSRNTYLRGLSGIRKGEGKHKPFRVLTEYRRDIWITWLPDYGSEEKDESLGLVIRIIKNPYNHGQIPIVRLVYIPIDDDIYGLSEIEPGRTEQKAVNALVSGFIEAVSSELYPILKGHPTNVDWKTVEFKPRAAWIMNNPSTDLVRLEGGITFIRSFVEAYRLLVSSFAESMGDTAADTANLALLASDKTATEIKDLALQRGSRDALNKLFLATAIAKIYNFWWEMDKQFLTDKKIIRIAGKDAIRYFIEEGLNGWTLSDEGYSLVSQFMDEQIQQGNEITFEEAYEYLRQQGMLEEYAVPLYPVKTKEGVLPKLMTDEDGKTGFLTVEKEDLSGQYRFMVDLNTLGMPNDAQMVQSLGAFYKMAQEAKDSLAQEGYKLKTKELLEILGEKMQIKNVEQLFEAVSEEGGVLNSPPQFSMEQIGQALASQQTPQPQPQEQVTTQTQGQPPVTPEQLLVGA